MLQQLYILNLFGLYTYTIDFSEKSIGNGLKFITGPNGYGKTTILDIISAIYSEDFIGLSSIPFDMVRLTLDDGMKVKFFQHRYTPNTDIDSDVPEETRVHFDVVYYEKENSTPSKKSQWTGESENIGILPLHIYFSSHPIYYIRDQRLAIHVNGATRIENDAKGFSEILRNLQATVSKILAECLSTTVSSIDKDSYLEQKKLYKYTYETLSRFNLLGGIDLSSYSLDKSVYLNAIINALRNITDSCQNLLEKLSTFVKIIDKSKFANKEIQVSPMFGFRFIADNEDHTILNPESLSSGEKQILILTYELLFATDDASIVLIDEPELSFHVAWQSDFLGNLADIASLKALQCIVSTHSSMIFRNKWELSTDLYGITHYRK